MAVGALDQLLRASDRADGVAWREISRSTGLPAGVCAPRLNDLAEAAAAPEPARDPVPAVLAGERHRVDHHQPAHPLRVALGGDQADRAPVVADELVLADSSSSRRRSRKPARPVIVPSNELSPGRAERPQPGRSGAIAGPVERAHERQPVVASWSGCRGRTASAMPSPGVRWKNVANPIDLDAALLDRAAVPGHEPEHILGRDDAFSASERRSSTSSARRRSRRSARRSRSRPSFGGALANVAVAAAREGAEVELAGGVGDDPWGDWLRERLAAEGVGLRWFSSVRG